MKEARIAALACTLLAACGGSPSSSPHITGEASSAPRIALGPGDTPFRLGDIVYRAERDSSPNPFGSLRSATPILQAGLTGGFTAGSVLRVDEPAADPLGRRGARLATASAAVSRDAPVSRKPSASSRKSSASAERDARTASRIAEALGGLLIPVLGVAGNDLRDSFRSPRVGHIHDAIDIPAPLGTPVVAAVDGTVLRKKWDVGGGRTIRIVDLTGKYLFYYAHLNGYAPGLEEGDTVREGQVLGFVGRTGRVVGGAHLHLRIGRLRNVERWWKSDPVNPYLLLRHAEPAPQVCVADTAVPGCP